MRTDRYGRTYTGGQTTVRQGQTPVNTDYSQVAGQKKIGQTGQKGQNNRSRNRSNGTEGTEQQKPEQNRQNRRDRNTGTEQIRQNKGDRNNTLRPERTAPSPHLPPRPAPNTHKPRREPAAARMSSRASPSGVPKSCQTSEAAPLSQSEEVTYLTKKTPTRGRSHSHRRPG